MYVYYEGREVPTVPLVECSLGIALARFGLVGSGSQHVPLRGRGTRPTFRKISEVELRRANRETVRVIVFRGSWMAALPPQRIFLEYAGEGTCRTQMTARERFAKRLPIP